MTLALDSSIRNGMLDQITTRAGASAQLIILSGTRPATGGSSGSADQSVLERNNHPSRDGVFLQPTLTNVEPRH